MAQGYNYSDLFLLLNFLGSDWMSVILRLTFLMCLILCFPDFIVISCLWRGSLPWQSHLSVILSDFPSPSHVHSCHNFWLFFIMLYYLSISSILIFLPKVILQLQTCSILKNKNKNKKQKLLLTINYKFYQRGKFSSIKTLIFLSLDYIG